MCKFRTLLINAEQNADDISIVDMTMNIKCNGFSSIQNLYRSSSRANFLSTYRGIEGNAANKVMELTVMISLAMICCLLVPISQVLSWLVLKNLRALIQLMDPQLLSMG